MPLTDGEVRKAIVAVLPQIAEDMKSATMTFDWVADDTAAPVIFMKPYQDESGTTIAYVAGAMIVTTQQEHAREFARTLNAALSPPTEGQP